MHYDFNSDFVFLFVTLLFSGSLDVNDIELLRRDDFSKIEFFITCDFFIR